MWLVLFLSLLIIRQEKTELLYKPTLGSVNLRVMDDVTIRARNLKDNEIMIVIVRLGKGENPKLDAYRLQQFRSFLSYQRKLPLERFIFAQGETTDNYGRVEFYVDGKLFVTLAADKNLGIPLCCDCIDDSSFTPSFIRKSRHKR